MLGSLQSAAHWNPSPPPTEIQSSLIGPWPSRLRAGPAHEPYVSGKVVRKEISRLNNYGQAGERYRTFEPWERDELISNLVTNLKQCNQDIQARMVWHFSQCDEEYGRRVAEGLGIDAATVPPVPAASARV